MEYEIYMTMKCTRNCAFCYVSKNNYTESLENIQTFINHIQNVHTKYDDITINIFGGEPTMNIDGVNLIVDSFVDYKRCKIILFTNGDLLQNLQKISKHQNLKLRCTAYDFIENKDKYLNICNNFDDVMLSYTFSQDDIEYVNDFVDFCVCNSIEYKIAFSHSPSSWNKLNVDRLHAQIYEIISNDLKRYVLEHARSYISEYLLKRVILETFQPSSKHCSCLDVDKQSFAYGKFYGKCIRFLHEQNIFNGIPISCQKCCYKFLCNHSCHAELKDNDVVKCLCVIQKTMFDATIDFLYNYKYNQNIKKLINSII